MKRPDRAPRVRILSALVLTWCFTLLPSGHSSLAGPKGTRPVDTGFVYSRDLRSGGGEIVAFDVHSMAVLVRWVQPALVEAPELLVTPDGGHLFILGDVIANGNKDAGYMLSSLDPRSGKTLNAIPMRQRMRYIGPGPPTMVLSPMGSRLFVYNYRVVGLGGAYAKYWLSAVNTSSLTVLPTRVDLSGCGPAYFATAKKWVVALCSRSNDIRFVDPVALRVVKRVRLPAALRDGFAGLVVPRDGNTLYAVSADLRIAIVTTGKQTHLRTVSGFRQKGQTVSSLYAMVVSADDRQLIIGTLERPRDTGSPFWLRPFYLPSFKPSNPVHLPRFTHIVTAPGGGLYAFPMGDSSDSDWRVQYVNPDLSLSRSSIELHGPIVHLVVPSTASSSHVEGGSS